MVHIIIPGTPPTTNTLYRRHGHIIYMTKEGKDYKEMCQWEIKSKYKDKPRKEDVSVIIEFYFKDSKRRDLDNFLKIILDSFTGFLWEDDSQIIELVLRKFIDKKNPRVEISIF